MEAVQKQKEVICLPSDPFRSVAQQGLTPPHQTYFQRIDDANVSIWNKQRGLPLDSSWRLQLWVVWTRVMCQRGHFSWGKHTLVTGVMFFFSFQLQVQNGPVGHRSEGEPSGIPIALVLVPVFALAMVAAWAFMRYRQRLWKACCLPVLPTEDTFLSPSHPPPLPFSHILPSLRSQHIILRDCLPSQDLATQISKSLYSNGRVKALFEDKTWLGTNGELICFARTTNRSSATTQRGKGPVFPSARVIPVP